MTVLCFVARVFHCPAFIITITTFGRDTTQTVMDVVGSRAQFESYRLHKVTCDQRLFTWDLRGLSEFVAAAIL
jgi:hypothetical protein